MQFTIKYTLHASDGQSMKCTHQVKVLKVCPSTHTAFARKPALVAHVHMLSGDRVGKRDDARVFDHNRRQSLWLGSGQLERARVRDQELQEGYMTAEKLGWVPLSSTQRCLQCLNCFEDGPLIGGPSC